MDTTAIKNESRIPIREVHIDGYAVLKIIKHCDDNVPTSVVGSLLGVDYDGILEVSYTFPFVGAKSSDEESMEEVAGEEYQLQMMRMLEEVEVDSNCVGWYQSTSLGTLFTNEIVNYQYSYQSSDQLSANTVVIIYDPILSRNGGIVLKAFKLSDRYMEIKRNNTNEYLSPSEILQELTVKIKNVGHVAAYLRCLQDSSKESLDLDFSPLSLQSNDTYTEKHLEFLSGLLDDFIQEQHKFIQYSKSAGKPRQEHMRWLNRRLSENAERYEAGDDLLSTRFEDASLRPIPEVPPRTDALLEIGQLNRYCNQLNQIVDSSLQKLVLTSQVSQTN